HPGARDRPPPRGREPVLPAHRLRPAPAQRGRRPPARRARGSCPGGRRPHRLTRCGRTHTPFRRRRVPGTRRLLLESSGTIPRSSTAEHPTVNRTVAGSNPAAGADRGPEPRRFRAFVLPPSTGPDVRVAVGRSCAHHGTTPPRASRRTAAPTPPREDPA